MTSNSEAETQARPVSSKSCAEVVSNEESSTTVASTEVNGNNKQSESTLEQNELQKSDSSTENLLEEHLATKALDRGKLEPIQHDIMTIEEETDRDVNTIALDTETKQQEENKSYDTDIDRDIEIIEENKNKCSQCLVEVFYCMTWYFRNIKNGLVDCFRRCRNGDFKCSGSGSVDSDDQEADYVYNDLNETFNKDLSYDPGNSFDFVNARDSNTSDGLVLHGKYRGYDNSAIDVGQDNSGGHVSSGDHVSSGGRASSRDIVNHDNPGGHITNDNSGSHVQSGSDLGINHAKSDDNHVSSGGNAGICHARSDVGHVTSASDHSSGHTGFDTHVSIGDDGCYISAGDGGCDSGGGDCD